MILVPINVNRFVTLVFSHTEPQRLKGLRPQRHRNTN
jgi:hypothetical protein